MGIEVLPPDVNASDHGFVVSGNSIRFGLDAVKNVGHAAVQAILDARSEDGEFTSLYDFCERVDTRAVNKRAVECLVKCGALDSTGATRRGMLEALPMADGRRPEGPGGLAAGPGLDLRPRRRGRRRGRRRPRPAPADRPRRVRPARAAAAGEGDARDLPLLAPAGRGRATRCGPGSTARSPSWRASRTARSSPSAASSPSSSATRPSAGTRWPSSRSTTSRARSTRWCSASAYSESVEWLGVDSIVLVKGRLDHQERGQTKLVAQELERFEPTEDEVARARQARAAEADRAAHPRRRVRRLAGGRAEGASSSTSPATPR